MSKPEQTIQKELRMLGAIDNKMVLADNRLVAMCSTEQEAFRLCVNLSRVRRTQESLADLMGMSKGALNTILNADHAERARNLSRVKQIQLQALCGNTAIDQWADLYARGLLNCQRSVDERLAELEEERARLEKLRGAA